MIIRNIWRESDGIWTGRIPHMPRKAAGRRYMKKRVVAIVLAAMTAASLAACGGSGSSSATDQTGASTDQAEASADKAESSGEPITLSFWNGFTSGDGEVLQQIVDEFNASNDKNITIEMDVMPWDSFNEKLPAAITAGNAPDFVLCSSGYYPPYVKENSFQDVSDFYELDGVDADDFEENVKNLLYYDGKCIGIPMQMVSHYLFWDKDLYAAAGLDAENGPSSWEEIVENAKILTDKSKNQYGFNVDPGDNVVLQYALFAQGGDLCNADETEATLNTDAAKAAVSSLKELSNYSPKDMDDNTFISGQLGQFINGPWIISGLRENDINFGVKAVPAAEGKDPGAVVIPVGFSIPVTTSDEHKQAVYEFVKYWNTTDNCTRWTKECGTPAYLKSAEENFKDDPLTSALSVPLQYGHVACKKNGVSSFKTDVLQPMMEAVINDNADIPTTLDKYNAILQEKLDKAAQ